MRESDTSAWYKGGWLNNDEPQFIAVHTEVRHEFNRATGSIVRCSEANNIFGITASAMDIIISRLNKAFLVAKYGVKENGCDVNL